MSTVIKRGYYMAIIRVSVFAELELGTFIYTSYADAKAHTITGDYVAWVRWNEEEQLKICLFIDDKLAEVHYGEIDPGKGVLNSSVTSAPLSYNIAGLPTYDPVSFIQR